MKTCNVCKIEKPIDAFARDKSRRDGHQYKCKDCLNAYSKIHYAENREKYIRLHKEWAKRNPDDAKMRAAKWRADNPEKVREAQRKHGKKRYAIPKEKLRACMSARVNESLRKGTKAHQSWMRLVGYTVDQLKRHLEKQFKPGMTWENYGTVWHVDHKIPVAVFNFERPGDIDFRRCWSLKNLQPLEASKNHSKGGKIDKPFQPSLAMEAA